MDSAICISNALDTENYARQWLESSDVTLVLVWRVLRNSSPGSHMHVNILAGFHKMIIKHICPCSLLFCPQNFCDFQDQSCSRPSSPSPNPNCRNNFHSHRSSRHSCSDPSSSPRSSSHITPQLVTLSQRRSALTLHLDPPICTWDGPMQWALILALHTLQIFMEVPTLWTSIPPHPKLQVPIWILLIPWARTLGFWIRITSIHHINAMETYQWTTAPNIWAPILPSLSPWISTGIQTRTLSLS